MAKENKKQVEQITDMEVDFAQWYTDVCKKAELIDYSSMSVICSTIFLLSAIISVLCGQI